MEEKTKDLFKEDDDAFINLNSSEIKIETQDRSNLFIHVLFVLTIKKIIFQFDMKIMAKEKKAKTFYLTLILRI